MSNTTIWNGYTVYGDAAEIDAVIAAEGFISIEKTDVLSLFTGNGDVYVYTTKDSTLHEAIDKIRNSICIKEVGLTKLFIQIWAGKGFKMSDLNHITELLSNSNSEIELTWGVCIDDSCLEDVKATVLASQK